MLERWKRYVPALKDHLCAKFHPNPSRGLDFYREQTHRQTHITLYVLEDGEVIQLSLVVLLNKIKKIALVPWPRLIS